MIRDEILSIGLSLLGKLYWSGESGPDYFDTSGLLYYVYNFSGVPIDRKMVNEYFYDPSFYPVDSKDLQIGDLVFYGNAMIANDIGIYMGNSKVLILQNPSDYTKGDDETAVVSLLPIDFKSNMIGCKIHSMLSAIDQIVNESYTDTSDYDTGITYDGANTSVELKQVVDFSIKTYIYNYVTDTELELNTYFELLMDFGAYGQTRINVLEDIQSAITNTIETYKASQGITDDMYIDIMEYEVGPSTPNIYAKMENSDTARYYDLGEYIYFYSQVSTEILPGLNLECQLIDKTIIMSWMFVDGNKHDCTFQGYMNNNKIFEYVDIYSHIQYGLEAGKYYEFKIIAESVVKGTVISNIVIRTTAEEVIEEASVENTEITVEAEESLFSTEAIFDIDGQIDVEEYEELKTTLTVLSSFALDSPIYPENEFSCEMNGELEKGTEFYYDIWVDIKTLQDSVVMLKKEMQYINKETNGSFTNQLDITDETVYDLMKSDIIAELQRLSIDHKDRLTPNLKLEYTFQNTIPLELEINLYRSGTYKELYPLETNTDIIMDIEIINQANKPLSYFINEMRTLCPDQDTDNIILMECENNGQRVIVARGE